MILQTWARVENSPLITSADNRSEAEAPERLKAAARIFVLFDGLGLVAKRLERVAKSNQPRLRIHLRQPGLRTYA